MIKTVICTHGENKKSVDLPIPPSKQLKPQTARMAAWIAFDGHNGVTVWDNEYQRGYRLYANSARKLSQS